MMNPDKAIRGAAAQAAAIGVSRYTIQAMRKAARNQPDSPFRGQLATKRDLLDWWRAHPEFVASHQWPRKSRANSATQQSNEAEARA